MADNAPAKDSEATTSAPSSPKWQEGRKVKSSMTVPTSTAHPNTSKRNRLAGVGHDSSDDDDDDPKEDETDSESEDDEDSEENVVESEWYSVDEYEGNKFGTIQAFDKFLSTHGLHHAFQDLRGTEKDRYAEVVNHFKEKRRTIAQHESNVESLLAIAKSLHSDDLKGRSGTLSEAKKQAVHQVRMGIKDFETYRSYHRPEYSKRQDIETHHLCINHPEISPNEVKVIWLLLKDEPYMGYLPGEHILEVRNTQFFHDGTVPFSPEEYLRRYEKHVFPGFIQMVAAFLAFDVNIPSHFPGDLRTLFENPPANLLAEDFKRLQRRWMTKFQAFPEGQVPSFIKHQAGKVKHRLAEGARLLFRFKELKVEPQPGWEDVFWFVEKMTGETVTAHAQRYLSETLLAESKELLRSQRADEVLLYWNENMKATRHCKNIHEFYANRWPEPAPFSQTFGGTRLAELEEAAYSLLDLSGGVEKVAGKLSRAQTLLLGSAKQRLEHRAQEGRKRKSRRTTRSIELVNTGSSRQGLQGEQDQKAGQSSKRVGPPAASTTVSEPLQKLSKESKNKAGKSTTGIPANPPFTPKGKSRPEFPTPPATEHQSK